jgi:hypothetical protein
MTNQGVNFQLPSGGQISAAVDTGDRRSRVSCPGLLTRDHEAALT